METLTIQTVERLNSSANGNPAFMFTFTNGSQARSMSDAGFCYAVGNKDMREGSRVMVEFTSAGRVRHMKGA